MQSPRLSLGLKVKVKFTLEEDTKAHKGSRGLTLGGLQGWSGRLRKICPLPHRNSIQGETPYNGAFFLKKSYLKYQRYVTQRSLSVTIIRIYDVIYYQYHIS